jgi:hypothetical protein
MAKAGAELRSNIFYVDSYVGIKESLKKNKGSPLEEDAEPADIVNIGERKIVENEMEVVKILLEGGKFDKDVVDTNKSIEFSQSLENYQSRNINISEKLIDKNKSELKLPRNCATLSRNVRIMKRKQMYSSEVFKSKLHLNSQNLSH